MYRFEWKQLKLEHDTEWTYIWVLWLLIHASALQNYQNPFHMQTPCILLDIYPSFLLVAIRIYNILKDNTLQWCPWTAPDTCSRASSDRNKLMPTVANGREWLQIATFLIRNDHVRFLTIDFNMWKNYNQLTYRFVLSWQSVHKITAWHFCLSRQRTYFLTEKSFLMGAAILDFKLTPDGSTIIRGNE